MHKFKQYLFVGGSLLILSFGVLSAENESDLPFLQILTEFKNGWTLPEPTEPQSRQITDAIAGFWLSSSGKEQILAFSAKNSALLQEGQSGDLNSFKIQRYGSTSLTYAAERLRIGKARLLEKQKDPDLAEPYKKKRVYPRQEMIEKFIVTTKNALTAGYKKAEEMTLTFETFPTFNRKQKRQTLRLLLIGDDLYLADASTYFYTHFDRQAVLWSELAKENPATWAKFNLPLISAQRQVGGECARKERRNLPAEECRAFWNRAAELGPGLPPAPVKTPPQEVAKRGAVELHLAKYMRSTTKFGEGVHRPALDYCIDFNKGQSGQLFYRQLNARSYRNTLWSLNLDTAPISEKPTNWSEQEYREMGSGLNLRSKIFLREDGVLGLTASTEGRMLFDAGNKWTLDGERLLISLDNDKIQLSFSLNRGSGQNFSGNIQPAPTTASLSLIHGNYVLYSSEIPYDHPKRVSLVEAQKSQNCNGNFHVAGVTLESMQPLPEATWPTREKGSFPLHWHIRNVPIYHDAWEKTPTPIEIERGSFLHLRESGEIGRNREKPTDYDYSIDGQWRIDGSTMRLTLGSTVLIFESDTGFTQGVLSNLLPEGNLRYVIFPADLLAGAAANPEPKPVAAAPAPKPVPVPVPIPTPTPAAPIKAAVAPAPKPTKIQPEPETAPIIACWNWSNGARIQFQADGTVSNGPIRSTWKKSSTEKQYSVTWPPIEENIKLGKNQSSFSGTGAFNVPISASRQGSGQGLPGRWLRSDGLQLDIAADGSIKAGPLQGNWSSKTADSYTIAWPIVDQIIVSADGESLDISNQFGKATAVKNKSTSGCR